MWLSKGLFLGDMGQGQEARAENNHLNLSRVLLLLEGSLEQVQNEKRKERTGGSAVNTYRSETGFSCFFSHDRLPFKECNIFLIRLPLTICTYVCTYTYQIIVCFLIHAHNGKVKKESSFLHCSCTLHLNSAYISVWMYV